MFLSAVNFRQDAAIRARVVRSGDEGRTDEEDKLMTLNIDAEDLSLWSMMKFLIRLAVAAMPAYFLCSIVQVLIVPFWASMLRNILRH